jgi:radical SAM protein with 4Fe4S-binding SPASM domain
VVNLRRAGLSFAIQAVLTPETLARMGEVAAFTEREGGAAIQLVPFEPVRRPIYPIDQASLQVSPAAARGALESIKKAYPNLAVTLFEKGERDTCDELHCDIGGTKLFFTPAGRVHRCYKLTEDETLFGLDLSVHGIASAWHDTEFSVKLVPRPEAYAETPCSTCGNTRHCNASGRCIFQAQLDYGQYAAPDRFCGPSKAWSRRRASPSPDANW